MTKINPDLNWTHDSLKFNIQIEKNKNYSSQTFNYYTFPDADGFNYISTTFEKKVSVGSADGRQGNWDGVDLDAPGFEYYNTGAAGVQRYALNNMEFGNFEEMYEQGWTNDQDGTDRKSNDGNNGDHENYDNPT